MININETHDPAAHSWVESANRAACDFPLQNLPFGVFRHHGAARVGVAIGDQILDVSAAEERGLFASESSADGQSPEAVMDFTRHASEAARACRASSLNQLMALGERHWSALRRRIFTLLCDDTSPALRQRVPLVPMNEAEMLLPAEVGDYTDFYASLDHATNVGRLFRPDNPLLPNYKWLPIAYHGRASSLQPSGTPIRRPSGQMRNDSNRPPEFSPTRRLDYEVEAGFFIGPGNRLGQPIPIAQAGQHIFGLCLVNDWSARDVQSWEYQPLGPFLAKSFATTVSPWVVTLEALAPFRTPALRRDPADPQPLPHLLDAADQQRGGLGLTVEVWLASALMRAQGIGPVRLSRASLCGLYWTIAQMLAHHASNGCNLRPGDLLASGTVSGPSEGERGCLLEITSGGKQPIMLPGGEQRTYLEDGDEIILRGCCEREGAVRIGFGECRAVVLPAA